MGSMDWVTVIAAACGGAIVLWLFWRGRLPVWGYGLAFVPAQVALVWFVAGVLALYLAVRWPRLRRTPV